MRVPAGHFARTLLLDAGLNLSDDSGVRGKQRANGVQRARYKLRLLRARGIGGRRSAALKGRVAEATG